jgi:carboxyvinyl-carboxyphosphonate phosphorylmutase
MNFTFQRARFREILQSRICVHPGSVFDPVSARIAESLGFETGMFAGSVASHVILGLPDLALITLTEFAEQAYRICRAGRLPLLVDADHGYGNALNVMRTVEELETAGVAALTIEDTLLPAAFGETRMTLIGVEEAAAKMRAAVSARQDPGLVIVGRTQGAVVNDVADAIARARVYQETGVDALFFTGISAREQVDAISAAVRLPIMLGTINAALSDRDYLASKNVRVALQGHQPFAAAVQATYATLEALRNGIAASQLTNVATKQRMDELTRENIYADLARAFLVEQ